MRGLSLFLGRSTPRAHGRKQLTLSPIAGAGHNVEVVAVPHVLSPVYEPGVHLGDLYFPDHLVIMPHHFGVGPSRGGALEESSQHRAMPAMPKDPLGLHGRPYHVGTYAGILLEKCVLLGRVLHRKVDYFLPNYVLVVFHETRDITSHGCFVSIAVAGGPELRPSAV